MCSQCATYLIQHNTALEDQLVCQRRRFYCLNANALTYLLLRQFGQHSAQRINKMQIPSQISMPLLLWVIASTYSFSCPLSQSLFDCCAHLKGNSIPAFCCSREIERFEAI